jgi:hypothetical protein
MYIFDCVYRDIENNSSGDTSGAGVKEATSEVITHHNVPRRQLGK